MSSRMASTKSFSSSLNHLLSVGLVGVEEAVVLGDDEMADEGEGMLQLGYDGIFIVLVGQVIAGGDVGTTHADAIERQGEDVAAFPVSYRVAISFNLQGLNKVITCAGYALKTGVYLIPPLAVGFQHIEGVGKERHIGMVAADAAFFFSYSHKDFQMWTLLQAAQAYPDAVLIVGTQTLALLILFAPAVECAILLLDTEVIAM